MWGGPSPLTSPITCLQFCLVAVWGTPGCSTHGYLEEKPGTGQEHGKPLCKFSQPPAVGVKSSWYPFPSLNFSNFWPSCVNFRHPEWPVARCSVLGSARCSQPPPFVCAALASCWFHGMPPSSVSRKQLFPHSLSLCHGLYHRSQGEQHLSVPLPS